MFRSLFRVPLIVGSICLVIVGWLATNSENVTQALSVPPIIITGSILVAFIGAIAETIRRSLGNMVKLVDLLLESTANIAQDMSSVSVGEKSMPSAAQLTGQVYTYVIEPSVVSYLQGSFGFAGRPLAWAYRKSLGNNVRFAIKLIPVKDPLEIADHSEVSSSPIGEALGTIARNESSIARKLASTREKLAYATFRMGLVMLVPYVTIAVMAVAITIATSIWVWNLTAG